ncbi:hypothetical protein B0T14DRAFT_498513 [Immersiella caudata]|uniref:Transmembrane protein n=1 Tax=Immersiella caudata TaxID=314043 RepID=A0AA40BXK8_9PEZI|nr:hypothetical protein B0T14DRAFT_498513 [Immersiella caudata]
MGAYTSKESCEAQGSFVNCTLSPANVTDFSQVTHVGEFARGEYPPNQDIAGIGVLGTFLSVTTVSLLCSVISTIWWWSKNVFGWKSKMTREHKTTVESMKFSFSKFLEAVVVTCSDQQIFTGCAYAVTLRWWTGCEISAYHYNIVADMLLVTCATHLTAVTVARDYWENPWPSGIRIILTALLYMVTGILLSNAGVESLSFPTKVPDASTTYDPILLPAACFQVDKSQVPSNIANSLSSRDSFWDSAIPGWREWMLMFICYAVAVLVRIVSLVKSGGNKENGKRRRLLAWAKRRFSFFLKGFPRKMLYLLFGLYLVANNAVGIWTVGNMAYYVFHLRRWVGNSGWFKQNAGKNPEDDPYSFGQLVPVFLNLLLIFAIIQFIADEARRRTERKKARDKQKLVGLGEGNSSAGFIRKDSENPYFLPDDVLSAENKKAVFDVTVKPAVSADSDAITPAATSDGGPPGSKRWSGLVVPKQTVSSVVEVVPDVPAKDGDSEKRKAA